MFHNKFIAAFVITATSGVALTIGEVALAQAVAAPKIEEIAVIGDFVPDEKRSTSAVANVVDQQQFTRTGDNNIAEGLKRVSGLSTVGGKFVYVRGLGERYSTTLLNGAILPSPEPINRVVPLDLFPTAILDSVLVQKTYSAQYPSEFGGGVLQLRTKKSTDEFFWNVSSSLSYSPDVNFKGGLTVPGGDTDWLGVDDGYRDIPNALATATANGQELKRESAFLGGGGYSPEELQTIGRSLRNEYNVDRETLPANVKFATSLGNFHDIGSTGMVFNYLAAVDYSNSWDSLEIERNSYKFAESGLEPDDDLDYFGTEHSIDISSIFTAGIDFNPDHNVRLTSVLLRKTDDTVSETSGDLAAENFVRISEMEWVERALVSHQLQGDHYFPDFNELVVNWRYSDVTADRASPDNRRYRYDLIQGEYEFSTRADGNVRRYSDLQDTAKDFGVDFTMVFYGPMSSMITAKAGYVQNEKDRASEIRRYSFFDQGRIDSDILTLSLEDIFAEENIAPDAFELREFTRPTDNYKAFNESNAFYVEGEFNFDDRFRFAVGLRNEQFEQNVETFDLFRSDSAINAKQSSDDILPAFSATFINYDHQFRLAYSETLSRPDFRELSPAAFTNPVTGFEVVGNPNLEIAGIKNYDFRWEWYFAYSDYMSLGLFYKEFDKPIEAVIQPGADKRRSFANAQAGENLGVEYEVFKRLDFSFLPAYFEDYYVQANLAYIDSNVQIAESNRGVLTNVERPLQGQSDWLANAQIGYEPYSGVTATLLYHYYGERIAQVGTSGAPDLIEQPFGELNFVYLHEIGENWQLSFKAKNILDTRTEITQGGFVTTGYDNGRDFSFQVNYTF